MSVPNNPRFGGIAWYSCSTYYSTRTRTRVGGVRGYAAAAAPRVTQSRCGGGGASSGTPEARAGGDGRRRARPFLDVRRLHILREPNRSGRLRDVQWPAAGAATAGSSGHGGVGAGRWHRLAVGETVILLHPPLPLAGVSIVLERARQQNDRLLPGSCRHRRTPASGAGRA